MTANASSTGTLSVASCQTFPATVGMILINSEIIAGTCSGTTFTPISGGRGYNQTVAASHSAGVTAAEQLFVWANFQGGGSTQGVASIDASGGYLAMTHPGGGYQLTMLVKPIPYGPASSYTVTVGFLTNGLGATDQGCGVGFRQSSVNNESLVLFHATAFGAGFNIGQYTYIDAVYAGTYFNLNAAPALTGNGIYVRVQDTLSQRNAYVSSDGLNFALVHSVPEGDFLSPDQIVVGCTPGTTIDTKGSYFSWTEAK